MSNAADYVTVQVDGSVGTLTLNGAHNRNAFTVAQFERIAQGLAELEANKAVRAVVLHGAGKGFCAGADIQGNVELLTKGDSIDRKQAHARMLKVIQSLRDSRLVVVASVHGAAYGAGFSLAMACDLIVCTPDAQLCAVFLKLGVTPDMANAWLLTRAVGSHRAKAMLYLAQPLTGQQAHEAGLACRLEATPEAALATARQIAQQVAATPASALAFGKMLIQRGEQMSLEDAMALEQAAQTLVMHDSAEGFVNALKKP